MEAVIREWVNYFSIAKTKSKMQILDELVRTRLRIGIWKQWKKNQKDAFNKIRHSGKEGIRVEQQPKGHCKTALSPILCRALNNKYFTRQKYVGVTNYHYWKPNIRESFYQEPCT